MARIGAAAREILVEAGAAGLNTNVIAERAGVNIATVYRYYPDKYAILLQLFDEFETVRRSYVLDRIRELDDGGQWRDWVRSVIEYLAALREEDPSGVALRHAMSSSPDLIEADRRSSEEIARSLAGAFSRAYPHLHAGTADATARLVVEVITVGLDSAYAAVPPDRRRVDELLVMIEAYLSRRLDPPGPAEA